MTGARQRSNAAMRARRSVRWLRRATAVLVALLSAPAATVLLTSSPASAVGATETGVWWSGGPAPVPPSVPDGGMWVQQSANGQTAISAIRLGTESGEVPQSLFLTIHTNGAPIGFSIKACLTAATDWKPARGGPLAEAPVPDCETFTTVGQEASGKLVFDLAGLPIRDVYSFVLLSGNVPVPNVDPLLPVKPTAAYDVTFEKPVAADVQSTPPTTAVEESAGEEVFEFGPTFSAPEVTEPEVTFEDSVPSFFPPIETFAAPDEPRVVAAPRAARPSTPTQPQAFTPVVEASTGRDMGRLAAAIALVGLFAFGSVKAGGKEGLLGMAGAGAGKAHPSSGGRVSIYDWPPTPTALSRPLQAFRAGRAERALGVGADSDIDEAPVRTGKAPALR